MRFFAFLMGFAAVMVQSAQAQDEITVATAFQLETPVGQGLQAFADTLQACAGGSVEVEIFAGGALGSPQELAYGLQIGSIDMAIIPASALQQFSNSVGILSAPLIFNNRRHWEAALSGPVVELIDSELDDAAGLRVLGFMGGEQFGIASTTPITTPDDVVGLNVGVATSDEQTFVAFGANPVPMAFDDRIAALQAGAIDATEITADFVARRDVLDTTSEFTITNHRIFTDLIVMGSSTIDALSDDTRACLSEASETASEVGRNAVVSLERAALADLSARGVVVHRIDNRPELFTSAREVTSQIVSGLGAEELFAVILASATCPAWCDADTCDDDECKACEVCD